jgi:hypothetical protein
VWSGGKNGRNPSRPAPCTLLLLTYFKDLLSLF